MTKEKKILLLGAGFVAKPALEFLLRRPENRVTVACRTLKSANELVKGFESKNCVAISLDVNNEDSLNAQVKAHDLIISLIPYIHHVKVIKAAINHKKHVCTTSYVSEAIKALDDEAKSAGITIMNEIGLDPGIDHLYAVSMIDKVHREGGKILEFISFCGGLPAPECAKNPFGYKFSWSSRGVLLALRNSAKYYEGGKLVTVEGSNLMNCVREFKSIPGFDFMCYPNRDSTVFQEYYKIPEAETVIRGTLRYAQFPKFVQALVELGFLDDTSNPIFSETSQSWAKTLQRMTNSKSESKEDLIDAITAKCKFDSEEHKASVIEGLDWLELFSDSKNVTPKGNALDSLCAELEAKMQFGPGERDMIALQHIFKIENSDGTKCTRTSTLVEYGDPENYTAMARLVGIPCGIASQQILDGRLSRKGVVQPYDMEICLPLMEDLKAENIALEEKEV